MAKRARISSTFSGRLIGLLGEDALPPGEGMVIIPCKAVHTFFMRFQLDVIFVDGHSQVIKTIAGMKPFRMSPMVFKAYYAIELPTGTIEATQTKEKDVIRLS